jgi:FAD/FMN-containing dehydrogenase
VALHDSLVRIARGEVLSDEWSRQVYSVDASHYEITPAAVACPADAQDVQEVLRFAHSKRVPVTARGAGTGLLGQSLSDCGLVLDFTKHMNRIIEVGSDYVVVEPGVVKGVLDRELKKRGKFLPPDPASSNYCTVGGMIANNSSGVHCLGYGNTIDFIESLQLAYADGSEGFAGPDGRHDERLSRLRELLAPHAGAIATGYPKVSKNSCGYRLDAVVGSGGTGYMPHKVFAASEGTLGLVTSARMRVLDLPERRLLLVLGFDAGLLAALDTVPAILQFSPVALEMLDHTVLAYGEYNATAGCLLLVEFAGGRPADVEGRAQACRDKVVAAASGSEASVIEYASDEASLARIWAARKGALGDIMKMTVGSRRPIGLIEDTVVPPAMLARHAAGLLQAYRDSRLDYVMYGHVGDGNMHTRPLVDVGSRSESEMIQGLAARVFAQVIREGGTITGEHGDGLARVGYIESMYGPVITALFRQVKELFDPCYLLNPGKKVPIV